MHFELVQTLPEMEVLAEEWNSLLLDSAIHVPFLRNEYLSAWWETLGGGEWKEGELLVVTARQEQDNSLVGIAPLFFTHNLQNEPALMLMGSIEISDYLDIISLPETLDDFLSGLIDFLDDLSEPNWHLLDWYNLLEDSPTLPALQKIAQERGCEYHQEQLKPSPFIPLPGNWDEYLSNIDKKQRHEIRRKLRKAGGYFPPVDWYIVEDENRLDEEIDAFLSLMATDPEKEHFLTDVMRSQMRQAIHVAFDAGWLQLAYLTVGDERAAGYLNFDYDNQIWVYNSGFDPRFSELSTGWVLLSYLIEWAIDHQRTRFDFMRGDEDYKYRFGGVDRHVMRAVFRRDRNRKE